MNATKGIVLTLTDGEARVLLDAALSVAEDIDSYGYTPQQKAAYVRAAEKLREALR